MTLQQYIFENIEDIKKTLIKNIKSCDDERTLKKISRILNTNGDPDNLDQWFDERGLTEIKNIIINIIERFGETDEFFKIVRGEQIIPSSQDFLKGNDIYSLLSGVGLSRECLEDINQLRPNLDSTAVGSFEILCDMFLSDAYHVRTNKKRKTGEDDNESGDVMTKLSGAIELKTSGGAVKGSSINNTSYIDDAFERVLKNYDLDKEVSRYDAKTIIKSIHSTRSGNQSYFGSQQSIVNTLATLSQSGYTREEVDDILANCLMAQFNPNTKEIKDLSNFLSSNPDVFYPSSLLFSKNLDKKGREMKTYNYDKYMFSSLFGIIDLYFYHKNENWRYLTLFENATSGKYKTIAGRDCNSFDSIYKLIQKGKLKFDNKVPFGTERGAAAKIVY